MVSKETEAEWGHYCRNFEWFPNDDLESDEGFKRTVNEVTFEITSCDYDENFDEVLELVAESAAKERERRRNDQDPRLTLVQNLRAKMNRMAAYHSYKNACSTCKGIEKELMAAEDEAIAADLMPPKVEKNDTAKVTIDVSKVVLTLEEGNADVVRIYLNAPSTSPAFPNEQPCLHVETMERYGESWCKATLGIAPTNTVTCHPKRSSHGATPT